MLTEDKSITSALTLPNSYSSPEENNSVLQIWGKAPLSGHVQVSGAKMQLWSSLPVQFSAHKNVGFVTFLLWQM